MEPTCANTFDALSREVAAALLLIPKALSSEGEFQSLMRNLGWRIEEIPPPFHAVATRGDALAEAWNAVIHGQPVDLTYIAELVNAIRGLTVSVLDLEGAAFDPVLSADNIGQLLPRQLIDRAIIEYLEDEHAVLAYALQALGLTRVRAMPAKGNRPSYIQEEIVWSDFPLLTTDPGEVFRRGHGWGAPGFDGYLLLEVLQDLFLALGLSAFLRGIPDEKARVLDESEEEAGAPTRLQLDVSLFDRHVNNVPISMGIRFLALPAVGPHATGLAILPYATTDLDRGFSLGAVAHLTFTSNLDLQGGVGLVLRPGEPIIVVGGINDPENASQAQGELIVRLVYGDPAQGPTVLLGSEGGSRFAFRTVSGQGGLRLTTGQPADLFAELEIQGAELVIAPGEGDGFLQRLLPYGLEAALELALGLSTQRGFYFRGSTTLEKTVPTHISVGPIEIQSVSIGIRPGGDRISVNIGASITTCFGPVTATLAEVGLRAGFRFPGSGGNLGVLDVDIGFKPPEGMGVVVDAGPITGGGFLRYHEETGRYEGALELEVYDVSVKAIGLLDTRIPGGRPAYSFLLLVYTEFQPIPLGLGFTLNGVGGLAGIHRRMALDPLRERFRQGSLDHILFPADPVRDAAQIVSDLQAVFPPADGRYVFGPMAIIGWGTPTLLEGELGILLELPDPARLVLLGRFHVALPRKDKALVDLNLDVLGELDQQRQRLALDGRLRDSYVVSFPIEGELAMRMAGGDGPNFALAIGGFHPDYSPPAGFPKLKRVTVLIGADDNPRITLEGYLALTSNTLQVGAAASLYAKKGWFNISGEISFDALFTFSPFSFVTDFSGKVALRKNKTDLAAISLEATLSGPTPWHAAGRACLEIRWLPDICVGFDETFGREERVLPPVVRPWPLLQEAVENPESWSGERPSGVFRGATLSKAAGSAGGVLLDPAFGVSLRQTVVPLGRRITRFGQGQPPGGADHFAVTKLTVAGDKQDKGSWSAVKDFFAPAQFEQLTDDQKLSRPSFERMEAGLSFAQDAVDHGASVGTIVQYDTEIVDSAFETRPWEIYLPTHEQQMSVIARGAAARSPLRTSGAAKFAPPPATPPLVTLDDEQFVVASTVDLHERSDITPPDGKGAAYQALADYLTSHPDESGQLQVVSLDESYQEA